MSDLENNQNYNYNHILRMPDLNVTFTNGTAMDVLNLTAEDISATSLVATGSITASAFYGDGSQLTGVVFTASAFNNLTADNITASGTSILAGAKVSTFTATSTADFWSAVNVTGVITTLTNINLTAAGANYLKGGLTGPTFYAWLNGTDFMVTGGGSWGSRHRIPFSATVIDVGSGFNTTSGRYIPPVSGTYMFGLAVTLGAGTGTDNQRVILDLTKNGTSAANSTGYNAQLNWTCGGNSTLQGAYMFGIWNMNGTTDFIESFLYWSGTTTCSAASTINTTYFLGTRVF